MNDSWIPDPFKPGKHNQASDEYSSLPTWENNILELVQFMVSKTSIKTKSTITFKKVSSHYQDDTWNGCIPANIRKEKQRKTLLSKTE